MKCRDAMGVRHCLTCARPLEPFNRPSDDGDYVPCYHCVQLYRATVDGLELVDLVSEPPEFQRVVHDLISAWWAEKARAVQVAA